MTLAIAMRTVLALHVGSTTLVCDGGRLTHLDDEAYVMGSQLSCQRVPLALRVTRVLHKSLIKTAWSSVWTAEREEEFMGRERAGRKVSGSRLYLALQFQSIIIKDTNGKQ